MLQVSLVHVACCSIELCKTFNFELPEGQSHSPSEVRLKSHHFHGRVCSLEVFGELQRRWLHHSHVWMFSYSRPTHDWAKSWVLSQILVIVFNGMWLVAGFFRWRL